MSSKHDAEFDKLIKAYHEARPELMARAATMAVTFFKENFRRQGFLDRSLIPWEKRTSPISSKPLLINRGILRRGVKKKSINGPTAVIGVDPAIVYAEIQNNGGRIEITRKMRRFFWAMYYKASGGKTYNTNAKTGVKTEGNTQQNKALNEHAEFWKGLALTKKTHIVIPARPFIGDSVTLGNDITEMFDNELYKIFKQ
jgi:phage gpG-like protein